VIILVKAMASVGLPLYGPLILIVGLGYAILALVVAVAETPEVFVTVSVTVKLPGLL
jgi:hypothetical protein